MIQKKFKTIITGWSTFLDGKVGAIHCYHPVIPFKNYQKIVEQAVKAYWQDYGLNQYRLSNHNCEHFANSLVLGIDYSLQIYQNKSLIDGWIATTAVTNLTAITGMGILNFIGSIALAPVTGGASLLLGATSTRGTRGADAIVINVCDEADKRTNKNKGSTINLRNEINSYETNGRFSNLNSLTSNSSERMRKYEQEYQAQILAPLKTGDCIVM